MRVLLNKIVSLFLHWFFIGYWILKTGLDVYPGPFFLPARDCVKFITCGQKKV